MENYEPYRTQRFSPQERRELDVLVDEAAAEDLKKASFQAAEIWNEAIGFDLLRLKQGVPVEDPFDSFSSPLENNISEVKDGWLEKFPDKGRALGTTYYDSIILVEEGVARRVSSWFDIYINRYTYNMRDLEIEIETATENEEVFDLTSVILHEFGHGIGMPHNEDPASIMYPFLQKNRVKRKLCPVEARIIREIYEI